MTSVPERARPGGDPVGGLVTVGEAYARLESVRWPAGPRCPHCGDARAGFLRARAVGGRRTRTGSPTGRRVWKCGTCRRQFSVLTGTVWHGTRIALPTWLAILAGYAQSGALPTPMQLTSEWPLSPEAARHVRRLLGPALERAGSAVAGQGSVDRLLAGLLGLPDADADRLRRASVRRTRPLRQSGPSREYGTG
jgi:hypothetical protein